MARCSLHPQSKAMPRQQARLTKPGRRLCPSPSPEISGLSVGLAKDVVSAVDIDRFSRNQLGVIGRKDRRRHSHFLDADKFFHGRAFGGLVEQLVEMTDSRSGARFQGTGGDGVNANSPWPELIGEIAHRAL